MNHKTALQEKLKYSFSGSIVDVLISSDNEFAINMFIQQMLNSPDYYQYSDKSDSIIPVTKNPQDYIKFFMANWDEPKIVWEKVNNNYILKISISTGGLSEKEELMSKMRETLFWKLHWISERRGGHYEFEIDPEIYGFMYVPAYIKKHKVYKQLIYISPHLYDWIHISQNKKLIKKL